MSDIETRQGAPERPIALKVLADEIPAEAD